MAKIGIVIPTLGDRPGWLRECIASIYAQRFESVKILVVAPEHMLPQISDLEDVSVVAETGRSLSAAINQGWKILGPEVDLFGWLGDDDMLAADSLNQLAGAASRFADSAVFFGRTVYVNEKAEVIYRGRSGLWATEYMRAGQDYLPQPGSVYRTSALDTRSPLVDPTLRNAMDLDMFLRFKARGLRFRFVDSVLSYYRIHGEAITSQKGTADESRAVRERYPAPTLYRIWDHAEVVRKTLERAFVASQWHLPQRAIRKGKPTDWILEVRRCAGLLS